MVREAGRGIPAPAPSSFNKRRVSPPVLDFLYGDRAVTLAEAASRLATGHGGRGDATSIGVVVPGDPKAFRLMLTQVVVAIPYSWQNQRSLAGASAPHLRQNLPQAEVIKRAIANLQRGRGAAGSNVLCAGAAADQGRQQSDRDIPAVRALDTPEWRLLLSRIGDQQMLRLLQECSVFVPLPNRCFLQASGEPICKVALRSGAASSARRPGRFQKRPNPNRRLSSARGTAAAATNAAAAAGAGGALGRESGAGGTKRRRSESPETQELASDDDSPVSSGSSDNREAPGGSAASVSPEVSSGAPVHPNGVAGNSPDGTASQPLSSGRTEEPPARPPGGKRSRPSSWQRRKMRKLSHPPRASAPAAPSLEVPGVVAEPRPGSGGARGHQGTVIEREPFERLFTQEEDHRQGGHAGASAAASVTTGSRAPRPLAAAAAQSDSYMEAAAPAAAGGGGGRGGRAAAAAAAPKLPTSWIAPSRRLLPRGAMLYSASYGRYPGLPSSHLLSKAAADAEHGALRLFAAIFLEGKDPTNRAAPQKRSASSAGSTRLWFHLPQAPNRTPAAAHRVLPLLQQMIERNRRCHLGPLLDLHCPLPGGSSIGSSGSAAAASSGAAEDTSRAAAGDRAAGPAPRGDLRGGQGGVVSGSDGNGIVMECSQATGSTTVLLTQTLTQTQPPPPAVATAPAPGGASGAGAAAAAEGVGEGRERRSLAGLTLPELSAAATPPAAVSCFVWGCLRRLVPAELLGPDSATQRRVRAAVHQLVLLTRYEGMAMHQVIQGISTSAFSWLPGGRLAEDPAAAPSGRGSQSRGPCCASQQQKRQRWLVLWLEWLLGGLVVPLIRSHFYVTETEMTKLSVAFYRKPVWHRIRLLALSGFSSTIYRELRPSELPSELQRRSLGVASLRLVPKKTGVRPIVNLGAASRFTVRAGGPQQQHQQHLPAARRGVSAGPVISRSFRPVNRVLRSTQQVLKAEAARNPGALGSSVFSYNDAYAKLAPFLRRQMCRTASGLPTGLPIFVINVDVKSAFDSVCIESALGLAERYVSDGQYRMMQHAQVAPTTGGCRVNFKASAGFTLPPQGPSSSSSSSSCCPDPIAAAASLTADKVNTIVEFQGGTRTDAVVSGAGAKKLLQEHLRGNLVRMKNRWFLQSSGIPQGSVVSTLLCSMYLADLEATSLTPLITAASSETDSAEAWAPSADTAMARLVDDMLIITTSRNVAQRLVRQIHAGFPGHTVRVNEAKTALNFDMAIRGSRLIPRNEIVEPGGRRFIPWCGLLVNGDTLELQADYSRLGGCHVRSSMTMPLMSRPGARLQPKLCQYLRAKTHVILLDPTINSPATVRVNIYQAFLLCAIKFHVHCKTLLRGRSRSQKGRRSHALSNRSTHDDDHLAIDVRVATDAINSALSYMSVLVRRAHTAVTQLITAEPPSSGPGRMGNNSGPDRPQQQQHHHHSPQLISRAHVRWLGLHAFRAVLGRKQTAYKKTLLPWIDAEMSSFPNIAGQMGAVVDRSRHGFLQRMRF